MVASTGGLLFGYDIGVVEGALPQLRDEMHLDLGQQDMVVAIMIIGAIVGKDRVHREGAVKCSIACIVALVYGETVD